MSETRFAILSGAAWSVVPHAVYLAAGDWPSPVSLLMSTPVGAVVGLGVARSLRSVPLTGAIQIAVVSLLSLVAAIAAFAAGMSALVFVKALLAGVDRSPGTLIGIFAMPLVFLWGLVATGLVVVLWPLSALNHWWLGRLRARTSPAN